MRAKFIRVRDKDTGHQYDILPSQFREDAHVKLTRFEPSLLPRKPKHNVKTPRAPKPEADGS
ncbi:hypothetical protein ACQ3HE_06665 [Plantibacter auratus]|uniref:hypothetical protein n=1 Tax=Plantibacter auratus TaxID=272914 RepID=UPI003D32E7A0